MKFMMFMIPKASQPGNTTGAQAGKEVEFQAEELAAMSTFNEELDKAGALIAVNGLHSAMDGARVSFNGKTPSVTDGPFAESKEVIGGYWIIDVESKDKAVEWATRCPASEGDAIEIRQIFEEKDFPEEIRQAVKRIKAKQQTREARR